MSQNPAGSLLANEAMNATGLNQTATAASVWTTKLRTEPQRDSNADGLVIKS